MHGVQMPWAVPLFLKRAAQVEQDVKFASAPQLPQSEAFFVPVDMVHKSKGDGCRKSDLSDLFGPKELSSAWTC